MTPEQEEHFKQLAINTAKNQQGGITGDVDPKLLEHVNKIRFRQPHWKETQSEEQKQLLLAKAEAKRNRKNK